MSAKWVKKFMNQMGVNDPQAKPVSPPPKVTKDKAQRLLKKNLPNKSRKRGLRAQP